MLNKRKEKKKVDGHFCRQFVSHTSPTQKKKPLDVSKYRLLSFLIGPVIVAPRHHGHVAILKRP